MAFKKARSTLTSARQVRVNVYVHRQVRDPLYPCLPAADYKPQAYFFLGFIVSGPSYFRCSKLLPSAELLFWTTRPKVRSWNTGPKLLPCPAYHQLLSWTTSPKLLSWLTGPKLLSWMTSPELPSGLLVLNYELFAHESDSYLP
jgi:hypothetical protein